MTVEDSDTACYTALYWAFTPGFWKNHYDSFSGHNAWDYTAYGDPPPLTMVFANAGLVLDGDVFSGVDLYEALGLLKGGAGLDGAAEILLRAGIASLLNASFHEEGGHAIGPEGVFPFTSAEIIDMVNAAIDKSILIEDRQPMLDLAYNLDLINNGIEDINWDDPYSLP
jgi:hypothetical protein